MRRLTLIILLLLLLLPFGETTGDGALYASTAAKTSAKSANTTSKATKTPAKSAKNSVRKRKAQEKKTAARPKTSAEAKRLQEATKKEIKLTEEQIRENDKSVRLGLNELGKLETDIAASQKVIKSTTATISGLNSRISSLETGIAGNEKELQRLREEYLKAVKKMRIARKSGSDLAFIFASENFNQALRRMRYLRQFSEWKDRQSNAIAEKNKELQQQKSQLSAAKTQQDAALKKQRNEEALLRDRHAKQDAIVAQLRQNGDALKRHLSTKQAEANALKSQIAELIAAEEAKRIAEEKRLAEEKAKQEEARRLAEEKRLAEERRIAEEKRLQEEKEKELLAQNQEKQKEKDKKKDSKDKKQDSKDKKGDSKDKKSSKDKKGSAKEQKSEPKKDAGKSYADARKRAPRGKGSGNSSGSVAPAAAGGSNFASMKGNLPKPVSGSFKVTSRFGRQSLPDLPDVVYDNPGIDAEVASGASAMAVYEGKVSGVYMLPGYNTVVIVNHGAYYTVYGNIASPGVKVGDAVKAGHRLGTLAADADDSSRSSIHFEVWKSREKLNPLDWIR